MSYTQETNWMDELDSKLRNLEELEEARAKEAWEKHVVSRIKLTLVIPGQQSLTYEVKGFNRLNRFRKYYYQMSPQIGFIGRCNKCPVYCYS